MLYPCIKRPYNLHNCTVGGVSSLSLDTIQLPVGQMMGLILDCILRLKNYNKKKTIVKPSYQNGPDKPIPNYSV